jgi:hypothetical protein
MSRSWQSDVQLNYQTDNAATTAMSLKIHFIFRISKSDPITKQLYQSDPKWIFLFRNPNESDWICTPLVLMLCKFLMICIIQTFDSSVHLLQKRSAVAWLTWKCKVSTFNQRNCSAKQSKSKWHRAKIEKCTKNIPTVADIDKARPHLLHAGNATVLRGITTVLH